MQKLDKNSAIAFLILAYNKKHKQYKALNYSFSEGHINIFAYLYSLGEK